MRIPEAAGYGELMSMKKTIVTAIFAALVASGSTIAAPAHSAFPAFWSDFQTVVAKRDSQALTSLIKRPPVAEIRPVTPDDYVKDMARTLLKFRTCLAKAKPLKDGENYSVFCGGQGMYFERVEGEFKFVEFFAND